MSYAEYLEYGHPMCESVKNNYKEAIRNIVDEIIKGGNTMNEMSKQEVNILLQEKENIIMDLNIMKFTKKGFIVKLKFNNETKKEFVEYGENLGSMINELIKEFVEEKREEKIKQNEIEYHQEELQKLKEDK